MATRPKATDTAATGGTDEPGPESGVAEGDGTGDPAPLSGPYRIEAFEEGWQITDPLGSPLDMVEEATVVLRAGEPPMLRVTLFAEAMLDAELAAGAPPMTVEAARRFLEGHGYAVTANTSSAAARCPHLTIVNDPDDPPRRCDDCGTVFA